MSAAADGYAMRRLQAVVATERAGRYLQQLCRYWSHRLRVELAPSRGTIHLPDAVCRLEAEPGRLFLALEGDDPQTLERVAGVVADHLKRFAFRETPSGDWQESASV